MPEQIGYTGSAGETKPSTGPDLLIPRYTPQHLLDVFEKKKKESFEFRWIWEREWLRDILYVINRQWIYYHPTRREWVDKRLSKNVPRPTTNKIAEIVQSIRSNFNEVSVGTIARPIGYSAQNVATAEIIDKLAPLIHEEHQMDAIMRESDFWFIVNGNATVQVSWDQDKRFNRFFIPFEQCLRCQNVFSPKDLVAFGNTCPVCGFNQFQKALLPDGRPDGEWVGLGRGKTSALSPFEYAFPPNVTRFDDIPYIIRLRWRDKGYYEANYPSLAHKLIFEKSPNDRSLQIYKSLAMTNDIGAGSQFDYLMSSGTNAVEGITEYEVWIRPTEEFPEGFVMRVAGDRSPTLIHADDEGIPGPMPYKDLEGKPIFPFAHAPFEHIGGRLYGRSALSPLIQKQDQINQIDSLIQMIIQRMANPVWLVPEEAGIDSFTGDPGLVIKYNALAAGGNAKPERIAGENVPPTLFHLRGMYLKDLEELSGAYDPLKGGKPAGVESFSGMNLLVERAQARFIAALKARKEMHRAWFSIAIELERLFGPDQRTLALIGPNKSYTFEIFNNTDLRGNVSIHTEDGTNAPKSFLAKRAAMEHANQMRLLNPQDPEQKYTILTMLGLSDLVPSLDIHVQSALRMQDEFERWVEAPTGPPPLDVKPWYNPAIHHGERIKWLNSDHMRDLMRQNPMVEQIVQAHLQQLQMMMMPPPTDEAQQGQNPPSPAGGVGAGRTMRNSNRNAGSPTIGSEQGPPIGGETPQMEPL